MYLNNYQANNFRKLLVQPDGKIIGVGEVDNRDSGTSSDFLVARYNADGTPDTSFGDFDSSTLQRRGYTTTAFSTAQDRAESAVLQPDGKIIAGGIVDPIGSWGIARYNTDGTLDPTFDGDGMMTINVGSSSVKSIVIQSDGKILLVGAPNFTIARLNTDGSLDPTFGSGGKLTVNPSTNKNGSGYPWSIVIQRIPAITGEERIVVGGWAASGTSAASTYALMRFKPSGAIDTSFGSNGRVLTSFFGKGDQARNIIIDASNRILASGMVRPLNCSDNIDFGLARYSQNGVLDPGFSGDGKLTTDVYGGSNSPYGSMLQSDGKIVVSGNSRYTRNSASFYDFTLIRYNDDGTADSTFGPGFHGAGVVTTQFPDGDSNSIYSVVEQNGTIVAGGVSSGLFNGKRIGRPGLARYFQ